MSDNLMCPDDEMSGIAAALAADENSGMDRLEQLIVAYPTDARLHFLQGSVFASNGAIDKGRAAMSHAIELAPGYHLARFQLGLLELSSGNADEAERVWSLLNELSDDNFLKVFVLGLQHLIRDEFEGCRELLTVGIELNDELPEMNNDMRLILSELPTPLSDTGETSETHLLLQRYTDGGTRH